MGFNTTSTRIVIVEDRPGSRDGLVQTLSQEPDLLIIDRTDDPKEAFSETQRLQPELVVVRLSPHGKNRLPLIRKIRSANKQVKLLALSSRAQPLCANQALRCGADAYVVSREDDPDEVISTIRDVLAGHLYVSEDALG